METPVFASPPRKRAGNRRVGVEEEILQGGFQITADGRFISVDDSFSELFGYRSPADFLSEAGNLSRHRYAGASGWQEFMRGMREAGSVSQFELHVARQDGRRIWISVSAKTVRDSGEVPIYYEGAVRHNTPLKLPEQVLQEAEEKWRALVKSSGDCVMIADKSGNVFFPHGDVSSAIIGSAEEEIFSKITPASQLNLRGTIESVFRQGRAETLDLERKTAPDTSVWYEARVVPIDQAGAVERVILIASDITARRRAEEAVRESQRFIGRVADTSPAILYVYNVIRARYVYVNHQVRKILGFTSEEFLAGGSRLANELVHPDDIGLLVERERRLASAESDGVVFECVLRMRNIHHQWLWIRTRDVVFTRTADGRPEEIIGMAEDVTERRRSRQELERSSEQLRALSARLQEAREEERAAISRRVHDELGQALTALSWDLSWMKDRVAALEEPEQTVVADKLNGMAALTQGMMLTVRKIASELRPPVLDHFGLVPAIEWQANEFQSRYNTPCEVCARGPAISLSRNVSTALFRIFQEILTNVARHAEATKVRVQLEESEGDITLVVTDNGRGITEGQKLESLGILGMRERALLFGGAVAISAAPGKGTTVTVTVPHREPRTLRVPKKETLRIVQGGPNPSAL